MKKYFIRVNVKGKSKETFVVSEISTDAKGTVYHSLIEDRYYGLKFDESDIDKAIQIAKIDFGKNYTIKKEET